MAVFIPNAGARSSELAADLGARYPKLNAAFYHGGEPIRVIRPFLEGDVTEAVPAGDDRGRPVRASTCAGSIRW